MKGRVVLVPFPFDDLSTAKVRPAVCLTDPVGRHRHVIVAFITSQVPVPLLPSDLLLDSSRSDFRTTGLRVTSVLRLHRVVTVPTLRIQRDLGIFSPSLQAEVEVRLRLLFGL
jgi:mRNA interferase MazF